MVIGLIVKAGIVYAVIVSTRNYGVWQSPEKTQDVYNDATEHIEPYADQARRKLKICPPRPPPEGQWSFFGIHFYNEIVKAVFEVLCIVPTALTALFEKVPPLVNGIMESIRKYREDQAKKKEIKISKERLDDSPLVCRKGPQCKDKRCPKTPLIPPSCKPYKDDFIYEPRMPKKPENECPKCKNRQSKKEEEKGRCSGGEKKPREVSLKNCKKCRGS